MAAKIYQPFFAITQQKVALFGIIYFLVRNGGAKDAGRTLTVYGTYADDLSLADLSNFTFAVSGNAVTPTSAVEFYSDAACTQAISGTSAASAYWKATFAKDISAGSFTVTGKNSYGTISLMVAVNDGNVSKVEFLANTESFASKVNDYVKSNYPSSKTDAIYIGINDSNSNDIDSLSIDNVSDMDTKCGATYGALLVKKLVLAAASAEILS